jgi:hypothetical protein
VITIGEGQRLIKKLTSSTQDIMVYVHLDEIYHILNAVHQTVGHGGIRRTLIEVKRLYENITFPCVRVFIDLCEHCHKKSKSRQSKSNLLNNSNSKPSISDTNKESLAFLPSNKTDEVQVSSLTAELNMTENSVDSSTGSTSAHSLVSNDSGVSSVSSASSKRKVDESIELGDEANYKRKCNNTTSRAFTHSASSSVSSSIHQASVDVLESEDYDDNDETCNLIFLI